jgi:hypothetical protein
MSLNKVTLLNSEGFIPEGSSYTTTATITFGGQSGTTPVKFIKDSAGLITCDIYRVPLSSTLADGFYVIDFFPTGGIPAAFQPTVAHDLPIWLDSGTNRYFPGLLRINPGDTSWKAFPASFTTLPAGINTFIENTVCYY